MKPVETACYALLASAFMLGGLLLANIPNVFEREAKAEMVITEADFSVMTTKTRDGEESVFVTNNLTDRLLIYKLDIAKRQLVLVGNENLAAQFGLGGNRGIGGGSGR